MLLQYTNPESILSPMENKMCKREIYIIFFFLRNEKLLNINTRASSIVSTAEYVNAGVNLMKLDCCQLNIFQHSTPASKTPYAEKYCFESKIIQKIVYYKMYNNCTA